MKQFNSVELTDEEALLLDGKCRPEIQRFVDSIKFKILCKNELSHLPPRAAEAVSQIVAATLRQQVLNYKSDSFSYCSVCLEYAGYEKYKTNTWRHKKGDDKKDKPLKFFGLTFFYYISICRKCQSVVMPVLRSMASVLEAEIPKHFSGIEPRYRKVDLKKCKECGHKAPGYVFKYGKSGESCPVCEAKSEGMFHHIVDYTNESVLVDAKDVKD